MSEIIEYFVYIFYFFLTIWKTIAQNFIPLVLLTAKILGFWVILLSPILIPFWIWSLAKSRRKQ